MNGQHHHLPGRLRLRFTQLKNNLAQLAAVSEALRGVDGILSVETSPFTGGILIHYHAAVGATARFWSDIETVLQAHELNHDPRPLGRRPQGSIVPSPVPMGKGKDLGRKLALGMTEAVVDKLIERSAVALVAALL